MRRGADGTSARLSTPGARAHARQSALRRDDDRLHDQPRRDRRRRRCLARDTVSRDDRGRGPSGPQAGDRATDRERRPRRIYASSKAASLAGPVFSAAIIAAGLETSLEEVEDRCDELARRGLCLRTIGPIEWPDGTSAEGFEFVHTLHVDVLRRSPGAARRQRLHRRIGECLRGRVRSPAPARSPVSWRCTSSVGANSERGDRVLATRRRHRAAARRARGGGHLVARGLDLLRAQPQSRRARSARACVAGRARRARSPALEGYVAPEVERAYGRAWELCRQIDDLSQLLPVAGLYRHAVVRGEHAKGRRAGGAHAAPGGARTGSDSIHGRACDARQHSLLARRATRGRKPASWSTASASMTSPSTAALAFVYGDDPQVASLSFLAWTLWMTGYRRSGFARSRDALALAEAAAASVGLRAGAQSRRPAALDAPRWCRGAGQCHARRASGRRTGLHAVGRGRPDTARPRPRRARRHRCWPASSCATA